MDKKDIFVIMKKNIVEIIPEAIEHLVNIDAKLADLGANSVDRVDIIILTMEELGLKIPLIEFSTAKNIDGLVNIFFEKFMQHSS